MITLLAWLATYWIHSSLLPGPAARPTGTVRREVRVLDAADLNRPLAARFASALREAVRGGNREAWIAYESRSAVPPGREHESDNHAEGQDRRGPSSLVLHSTRDRTWATGAPDLVVLVRVHSHSTGAFTVLRVAGGTPSVEVDPGRLPVYWLAAAEVPESLRFLASLGPNAADREVREMLIDVISAHRDSAVVVPFLSRVRTDDNLMTTRGASRRRPSRGGAALKRTESWTPPHERSAP